MLINFSVMATPFTSKWSVMGAVSWLIRPLLRVRAPHDPIAAAIQQKE
jgi:hypothetical protein